MIHIDTGLSMARRGVGSTRITSTGGLSHPLALGSHHQSRTENETSIATKQLHSRLRLKYPQRNPPYGTLPYPGEELVGSHVLPPCPKEQYQHGYLPQIGQAPQIHSVLPDRRYSQSRFLLGPVVPKAPLSTHPPRNARSSRLAALGCSRVTHSTNTFPNTSSLQRSEPTHHVLLPVLLTPSPGTPTDSREVVYF
jgi:hypothetical protein